VAEIAGITPAAVSHQFREKRLSIDVLIAVISMTGAEGDELKRMLTIKDM
jgi:hypothetical protein